MKKVTAAALVDLLSNRHLVSNITKIEMDGVPGVDESVCAVIGKLKNIRYLDLSNCRGVNDAGLEKLFGSVREDEHGMVLEASPHVDKLEFMSIANASNVTDDGLRYLSPLRSLVDLCLFGCFKLTDSGIYHLGQLYNLVRFNYCGAYKITEASRRYLFSQNQTLLIYNSVVEFGKFYCEEVVGGGKTVLTNEEEFMRRINH